jgi:alpha-mannosidase
MDVIIFHHTHWDREWYRTFQEFRLRLVQVIDLLIEELNKNNLETFYFDGQTIALEDYLELRPENEKKLKDFIKAKKILIGPWYVLADEFLVSGESLVRNLLIGINQAKSFGCENFIGYLPDSFGHNSEMPKILSSFNIKNAVVWRGVGVHPSEFFWKSGCGCSIVTTYLTEGYFQDILHSKDFLKLKSSKLQKLLDKIKEFSTGNKILLPVGGDHLAPVINFKHLIKQINEELSDYTLIETHPDEYFNFIEDINSLQSFSGEMRDNSRNPILPGTLSTRIYLKQKNAEVTWNLSKICEPIQALLRSGEIFPERKTELDFAWKLLLKNHPHDSICGCSTDEVHQENMSRFHQVNQIANGITERNIFALSNKFPKGALVVLNLSNYNFSGVVSFKTTGELSEYKLKQFVKSTEEFPLEVLLDLHKPPYSEDIETFNEYFLYVQNVPPFSFKIIKPEQEFDIEKEAVCVTETRIKNSLLELLIDKKGLFTLKDLKSNQTFEALHQIIDCADIGDTYNFAPLKNDVPIKAEFLKTQIIEIGFLRGILRVFYIINIPRNFNFKENSRNDEYEETIITTDIILKAGSSRIEFETKFENLSKDHLMQIRFNLPEKITETVSENTFGLIKRNFDPEYSLLDYIPAEKGKELQTNTAPMQRFVFSQNLGILTQGLNEYEVFQNQLSISILRCVGKLSQLSINTRNFPAGPPLDTPGAQCLGPVKVNYALCITENPQELFRHSDEFMGSVLSFEGMSVNNYPEILLSFLQNNNPEIYIYSVKIPENKDAKGIVLRLMNISGENQTLKIFNNNLFSKIVEVNFLEEPIRENVSENIVFEPHEMKTLFLSNFY